MWAPGRGLGSGLRELVLLGLYVAYTASRTLASGEIEPARHHAAGLLALERSLNIYVELWLNHRVSDVPPIALAASYWYAVLHYIVTPTVLTWLYRRRRHLCARARNALIVATTLGLASYLSLPTAPPRLMSGANLDTLAQESQYGWWTRHASVTAGLGGLTKRARCHALAPRGLGRLGRLDRLADQEQPVPDSGSRLSRRHQRGGGRHR